MKIAHYSRLVAASAAVLMVSGGCAVNERNVSALSNPEKADTGLKAAAKFSAASQKAMKKGKVDEAIAYAENAVFAAPKEASYRSRLGQAYQKGGRFLSAEQAFAEARMLGDSSAKTLVSHSLSLTAVGETAQARTLLLQRRSELPASDYGLALALLGEQQLSVDVLEDAVRNGPPSSQSRQNLAFAYAMAGRWRESQVVGERDLTPEGLRQRMTEWAQLARPGAYRERVAAILGVNAMADDNGMPVMLALEDENTDGNSVGSASMMAPSRYSDASLAAVAPVAAPAPARAVEPAQSISAPLPFEQKVELLAEQNMRVTAAVAPAVAAAVAPVEKHDYVAKAPVAEASPAKADKPAFVQPAKPAKTANVGLGHYVVQLGAYSTEANAMRAWNVHAKRYPGLSQYNPADASVMVNGKRLYRVAATGFAQAKDARSLCKKIRALGGECMVRPVDGFSLR